MPVGRARIHHRRKRARRRRLHRRFGAFSDRRRFDRFAGFLCGEPREQTIDPALMGARGEQHWVALRATVKEAWVYPLGWVVYFDDKGVIEMLRKVSPLDVHDD